MKLSNLIDVVKYFKPYPIISQFGKYKYINIKLIYCFKEYLNNENYKCIFVTS